MATGLVLQPVTSRFPLSKSSSYGDLPKESSNISLLFNLRGYPPFELNCATSLDSIKSIGMCVFSKGFYTNNRNLLLSGRESVPDHSMSLKTADSEYALNFVLKISELVSITLKTASGKEIFLSLGRLRECRVKDVKRKICEFGPSLNEQIISFQGSELDDQFLLNKLQKDECTLHLRVKKAFKIRANPIDGGKLFNINVEVNSCPSVSETNSVEPIHSSLNKLVSVPCRSKGIPPLPPPRPLVTLAMPEYFSNSSLNRMIASTSEGLRFGHSPKLTSEGSGGCYFMPHLSGKQNVAVFKPIDEEPLAVNCPRELSSSLVGEGLKKGTEVGGGAIREVAAYFLDYPSDSDGNRVAGIKTGQGYSGVPPTAMVRCFAEGFHYSSPLDPSPFDERKGKIGSLQEFATAVSNCEDMGPSSFPASEVHKIAVLDMRLANTDRNGANILVNDSSDMNGEKRFSLTPIDHGYCFPKTFEDCTFEWLYWPQSSIPFTISTLRYISSLDSFEDLELLRKLGFELDVQHARILHASTLLLKKAAMAGLTAFDIGSLMVREKFDEESFMERAFRLVGLEMKEDDEESVFLQKLSLVLDSEIVTILASKKLSVRKSMASYVSASI